MAYNRRNKFHAKKVTIDGIEFDSKAEGAYYLHLKAQGIKSVTHQSFVISDGFTLNGKRYAARKYSPDFCIYDGDELVKVIDVKGGNATVTTDSKLRMVLFMIKYKVPVTVARYDYRTGIFEEKQV